MARTTAMMPMERYWRERKASAPSRIASDMRRMSAEPVSPARTMRARMKAAMRARTPTPRAIQSQIVSLFWRVPGAVDGTSWKLKISVASTPKFMKKIPLKFFSEMMEQIAEGKTRDLANGRIRAYADRTVNERTSVTMSLLSLVGMSAGVGVWRKLKERRSPARIS